MIVAIETAGTLIQAHLLAAVVVAVTAAAGIVLMLLLLARPGKRGRYPTAEDVRRNHDRGGIRGCPGCGLVGEHTAGCSFRPIG